MCGIAGILYHDGRKPEAETLRRMAATMIHRGPDGEGIKTFEGGGFAHRRLAIIDIEGGIQPMMGASPSTWITYNGEVYNFPELKRELESKGRAFHTRSDTEAILGIYESHGAETPKFLRGMFAFAIWDGREKALLIARDRIGKKPLFWFEDSTGIFFASELKALTTLPNCPREIDPEAIELYLAYQSIPGERTIYKGVNRLLPAHRLIWRPGSPARIDCYWALDWSRKTTLSYADAKSRLRELILDATRVRLISDVPLGAFLSGGVDSSVVVAAMAQVSDAPVRTFSIGFPEKDFTETGYARMVAEKFKTDHREFTVEPETIEILPKLVHHYDQPYADSSALPTYYLSKVTREHVTVALNGDGGDEFFGGYDRYRAIFYHQLYRRLTIAPLRDGLHSILRGLPEGAANRSITRKIRRFAEAARHSAERFDLTLLSFFNREQRETLYAPEFAAKLGAMNADDYMLGLLGERSKNLPLGDRVLRADTLGYLPNTLLVKVDVASMAASLETRSPLLDTEVMEFAASLPHGWKFGLNDSKKILKEAHEGILPHEILYRKKMGFGVPISHWFRGSLHAYIKEVLLDRRAIERGYFRRDEVEKLITDHQSGARNNANRLWALLMLELWHGVRQ